MRILPQTTTALSGNALQAVSLVASGETDQELRLLKERVQALESQSKRSGASDATELAPLLEQLKTDFETQAHKTLQTLEERLHSCEQAPRLFAVTFMKEVEERVHGELAALEKKIIERFEKLPVMAEAPSPVETPAEKLPAVAPSDWEARFESHEKALADLMKEISVASTPIATPEPVASPSAPEVFAPIEIPKPFETTAPDRMADHSLEIEWTPGDVSEALPKRSLATRLWYYLNEPAFGAPADRVDERPDDQ